MIPLFKFQIKGTSMLPAFRNGEKVLVNRLSYLFRKPKAGDVVVIRHQKDIIKRIAKVEKGKVFVVGDNGNKSTDSRNFGWIKMEKIVGKVVMKI